MKQHLPRIIFTNIAAFALPDFAQSQAPKADAPPFEEPPTLRAREILKPEYLFGPNHKVRDAVPTYSGANWFIIVSINTHAMNRTN